MEILLSTILFLLNSTNNTPAKHQGMIILSNTKVTNGMKKLWDSIKDTKYDITKYGFWGGTGIICLGDYDIIMQ